MIRSPAFRLKKHSETQIVAKIAKSGKSNREWEQGYSDTLLVDETEYNAHLKAFEKPYIGRNVHTNKVERGTELALPLSTFPILNKSLRIWLP